MINSIMLFLALQCPSIEMQQRDTIEIPEFDAVEWRMDSIGCKRIRWYVYNTLIKNKDKIINHTRAEVYAFLGGANESYDHGSSEAYYVEAGVQCLPHGKSIPRPLDLVKLIVDYKDDIVVDVHMIVV